MNLHHSFVCNIWDGKEDAFHYIDPYTDLGGWTICHMKSNLVIIVAYYLFMSQQPLSAILEYHVKFAFLHGPVFKDDSTDLLLKK